MQIRHFISIARTPLSDLEEIFATAERQKKELKEGTLKPCMQNKTLAMIFEKPSLRTRCSFETAMAQLGGHAMFLGPADIGIGKREAVKDCARVLSRYADIISARVFLQRHVEELAENSRVPVINAMSNDLHPCQALADLLTIKERLGTWKGKRLVYIGDGNNVALSLAFICAKLGVEFACVSPEGYALTEAPLQAVRDSLGGAEVDITIGTDPRPLVEGADAVYTDVWASMHQKEEAEERRKIFADYQVNAEMMKLAKPDAIALHCLPAVRGEEITDDVMDGPQAAMYDQAENRLHTQRALLTLLTGNA